MVLFDYCSVPYQYPYPCPYPYPYLTVSYHQSRGDASINHIPSHPHTIHDTTTALMFDVRMSEYYSTVVRTVPVAPLLL